MIPLREEIGALALPEGALLSRYAGMAGCYTDCYATDTDGEVPLTDFVTAFYTTRLFRLERLILKWALSLPSTDAGAAQVANGSADRFAAWTVEDREENQLLMRAVDGRTRSWFMAVPLSFRGEQATRLHFGSAVVPPRGAQHLGLTFRAALGAHRLYSRALLSAAKSRLER